MSLKLSSRTYKTSSRTCEALSRTQKNETRGIFGVTEEKSRHAKVAYIFAGSARRSMLKIFIG